MDWIWIGLQQEGIGLVQKNGIGFLDFTNLCAGCMLHQLHQANSYLPQQKWTDSGTPKIKVNPNQGFRPNGTPCSCSALLPLNLRSNMSRTLYLDPVFPGRSKGSDQTFMSPGWMSSCLMPRRPFSELRGLREWEISFYSYPTTGWYI